MGKQNTSTGSQVRAWAVEQGITEGHGSRGRLSAGLIESFNKAHPSAKYAPSTGKAGSKNQDVKVTLVNSAGKNYTRKMTVPTSELRELAGVAGTKGRLSQANLDKAVIALAAREQAAKSQPVSV